MRLTSCNISSSGNESGLWTCKAGDDGWVNVAVRMKSMHSGR